MDRRGHGVAHPLERDDLASEVPQRRRGLSVPALLLRRESLLLLLLGGVVGLSAGRCTVVWTGWEVSELERKGELGKGSASSLC